MKAGTLNSNQPLVSIIIPYYNSEKYLTRCVDSILAQTYRNLEVILVNDASEDASFSIAEDLAKEDPRVKNINVPHGGVSLARNAGLGKATGDFVMFADSDDWMAPRIVGRMVNLMLRKKADLVTCEIERTESVTEFPGSKESKVSVCSRDEFLRIFFKISSNEWVHFPVAKLYKRELLPNPLYPAHIRVGEDVVGTYLALSGTERIVRLKEVGYYYYVNPQSATSQFDERDFDLIRVWDMMMEITEGLEPDHSYAKLNRERINFTLLFRMMTELPPEVRKKKYRAEQEQLLNDLKKCEKDLLHSPIVLSRKILIFLLCHCFPLASFGSSLIYRILARSGSTTAFSQRRNLS